MKKDLTYFVNSVPIPVMDYAAVKDEEVGTLDSIIATAKKCDALTKKMTLPFELFSNALLIIK